MPITLWILLSLVLLILIVCIAIAAILTRIATSAAPPKKSANPDGDCYSRYREVMERELSWLLSRHPETWTVQSYDGLTLSGLYLPCEQAKGTMLLMHGYHGVSTDDFAATMRFYHDFGMNILLPDQRCHGRSEGKHICYGVRERFDCVTWLTRLNAENGDTLPVFLHGISMGAATVMMASGLCLPQNVRGVIEDCGFTSPAEEFVHVSKTSFHLPTYPIQWLARLFIRVFAGFNPMVSSLDAVKQGNHPMLFLHGGSDTFVPTDMGRALYAACPAEKELVIVPDATHALSLWIDPDRCKAAISRFLTAHL